MSARSAVSRLAEMDRDQLRFRLASEARKIAGRLRHSIRPLQWNRAAIVTVLEPHGSGPLVARAVAAARRQDYLASHRALAEHFRTRTSFWPIQAGRRESLGSEIRLRFPGALPSIRARADRIAAGRHDLLGYRDVALGNPPDWHLDAIHNRRSPMEHWAAVPYLDPASGDHKVIWETNRHQHFLTLGSAYWLTGERRYRQTFIDHLEDWVRHNAPLQGVNWASMLELAFRTMSWTWAVEFFCADAEVDADDTPWLIDLLISLDRQLTHVVHNLSTYFSPNTHLSGEALALYAVSTAFPELRRSRDRASMGRTVLVREAQNQVRADGGHAELSAHYHHYSTDFYLLALMVARASGDAAAASFEEAAHRQAVYLRTIADDRGRLPLIGDDDGGQLFRFGELRPADASVSLGVAASLLDDDALAVNPPSEETAWILGKPAVAAVTATGAAWPSRVLPDSGYFVSRMAGGGHLIFDAGPHGFLNGGHAHADALAIVVTAEGEPLLVDPGTATYTMDPAARDRFRSSRMHNTLVIDGEEHTVPAGPFHWQRRYDARFLVARAGGGADFAIGTHDGYGGRHRRAVVAVDGLGWLVVDRVTADRPTGVDIFWHLHPDWRATIHDATVELQHVAGKRLALVTTAQDLAISQDRDLSLYAPVYGRIEPSVTLVARHAAGESFTIGTFIPAVAATNGAAAIAEIQAAAAVTGWSNVAFAVRWSGRERQVSLAFPQTEAQPLEDWPQPCITRLELSRTN